MDTLNIVLRESDAASNILALRCVLMGDQSLLIQCADVLRAGGHEVIAVVTQTKSIANWAMTHGIEVVSDAVNDDTLAGTEFDWLFSIANLRVVPKGLWSRAKQGAVNFHDGPLPRYAGLNTPNWALLAGETAHGVTWHQITEEIDAGDIHESEPLEIASDDTAFTLNSKCFAAGIASFTRMVEAIDAGSLRREKQDFATRELFAKVKRPDAFGLLRLDRNVAELDRLVRALDFGPGYVNPMASAKLHTGTTMLRVGSLARAASSTTSRPGAILAVDDSTITVEAADGAVVLGNLTDLSGKPVRLGDILRAGQVLPLLDDAEVLRLTALGEAAARSEFAHLPVLSAPRGIDLPAIKPADEGALSSLRETMVKAPADISGDRAVAALSAFLLRESRQPVLDVTMRDDVVTTNAQRDPHLLTATVPLRVELIADESVAGFADRMTAQLARLRRFGPYAADIAARHPGLSIQPLVALSLSAARAEPVEGAALTLCVDASGIRIISDDSRIAAFEVDGLAHRALIALHSFAEQAERLVNDLPLMTDAEFQALVFAANETGRDYDRAALMHSQIERQVELTPDAIAFAFGDDTITYGDLDRRANRIAHALIAQGVKPDALVGLYVPRSIDLVCAALGVLKAGGAYVPLDPAYPADRLQLMIEDSGLAVLLTKRNLVSSLPGQGGKVMTVEDAAAAGPDHRPQTDVKPENLAYVIYTSGSTGRPKGVMLEHRNVVNFFAGMDERVAWRDVPEPVWLAVTSLSFDIAVLELFWTLTHGFKVVIGAAPVAVKATATPASTRGMDFSLFFWGNDDGVGPKKYELLLEGAKFADEHGFAALWTPERHFHAFGGPYPNPSVTGAAVASVTKNLAIRAGSCVLPLHHPARVAEEWAVIDNLSNGRAGLAFASGWMPEDFLLRPENAPPKNKEAMLRDIDTVRRLWRGEAVPFEAPGGKMVDVVTQPRPVSKELPVWVTTAGNPDTYRDAAKLGANVLTHLLGQSIDELAGKIRIYRETLAEAGHDPDAHKVTLMLHTLVGADREEVREKARGPMKAYLKSAAALIKQYAWAFPAFKKPAGLTQPMDIDLQSVSADEMDAILDFAFQRYFEDSGLFGTVEDALTRVDQLKAIGVDEVACLIDFGVPGELALERLVPLAKVVAAANVVAEPDHHHVSRSIAEEIGRHRVTHLQCTPSMAGMILADPEDRAALNRLRHLYLGGEALPGALAADIKRATFASLENMYGPTETTIWSSTGTVTEIEGVAPLGTAIANTQLYVLDEALRPVPPGTAGELYIGGDGVARGYLNRPELTAERFVPNPFRKGERIYRTGDLVRIEADATLGYIGRADHQVKVRGHRIELGEIEARMREVEHVRDAVVIVREDRPGDKRITGYLQPASPSMSVDAVRDHLKEVLPDFMMPAHLVTLQHFPLTPNAKVDRNALPKPDEQAPAAAAEAFVAPANDLQKQIADVFGKVLGLERVGLRDNFFALGGHSLLAVQAHRDLKAAVAPQLAITDLFRFPTVAALSEHLGNRGKPDAKLNATAERAAMRRAGFGRGEALRSRETA